MSGCPAWLMGTIPDGDASAKLQTLIAAGYRVYAVNPLSVARYRERHVTSGAKSDAGDAKVLADLVRTDRHQHRPIAGDGDLAEAVKVLARAQQNLTWSRQRQANSLRSALREFYPAALTAFDHLTDREALAVLDITATAPPASDRARHPDVTKPRPPQGGRGFVVPTARRRACRGQRFGGWW